MSKKGWRNTKPGWEWFEENLISKPVFSWPTWKLGFILNWFKNKQTENLHLKQAEGLQAEDVYL